MARTTLKIPYTDYEQANKTIREILFSQGYSERFKDGSVYWQRGTGVATAPQCLQFNFSETEITISGWISNLGKECALSGIFGMVPKKKVLETIQILKMNIK